MFSLRIRLLPSSLTLLSSYLLSLAPLGGRGQGEGGEKVLVNKYGGKL